jgi:hypothetical protein
VTGTARVGDCEPSRASAENEATKQQAGTRRNAQSRHTHVLLIPEETVADKAIVVRGFSHTSRHSSVESLLAEIGRPNSDLRRWSIVPTWHPATMATPAMPRPFRPR